MATKRLYRSRTNRVIAGVAGGIGEYFDIDPLVVRLIFVLLAIGGGSGVLLYLVAWLIIPEEPETGASNKEKHAEKERSETLESSVKDMAETVEKSAKRMGESGNATAGLILLVLGVLFLLQTITGFNVWGALWPLILVALGVGLIARSKAIK